ncbi:MAG TPA: N-acyl homoserine lactonase family protein [Candidatus Limnocylindrales bacterium]
MSPRDDLDVIALPMAEFTFPPDEPYAGQTGVVVAYAVRHRHGTFLFDTGFGFGSRDVDDRYAPSARAIDDVLARVGIGLQEITALANCHLHIDHAGQNSRFPGIPIHVQPSEWRAAHDPDYTILEWVDFDGADYRQIAGDHEVAPGARIFATPGHSPGHQSLVVDSPDGPILLAGQAVYSYGEWIGTAGAREGRTQAPDTEAYQRSVDRLRTLHPARVLFGHDRRGWPD